MTIVLDPARPVRRGPLVVAQEAPGEPPTTAMPRDDTSDSGAEACPIPAVAPPLPGPAVFDQQWRDLAFVHWAVDPVAVAHLFPAGTRPDVFRGRTYVGLVPFRMRRAGPGPVPAPYFGDFLETNVRLYSVDDQDRHGVLFRSLEASRLVTVLAARGGTGLPYCWSRMRERIDGDERTWSSRRRWPGRGPATRIRLRVGEVVEPSAAEVFVTARWGMHSTALGHTWWTPNEHGTWPLHEAEMLDLDDELVSAAGIDVADAPMLRTLFSPGVRTRFGRPHRLRAPRRVGSVVPVSFRPVRPQAPNAMPS